MALQFFKEILHGYGFNLTVMLIECCEIAVVVCWEGITSFHGTYLTTFSKKE